MASNTISGSINFAGLGSGTDFNKVIEQLKKIETIPKQRLEFWKADWQKRYDAFSELLTTIEEANSSFGKLNTVNKLLTKSVNSTNKDVATATATSDAASSNNKIDVKQLATNAVLTSTKLFADKNTVVSPNGSSEFTYTYNGKTNTVDIPKGMTLEGMVNQINKEAKNSGSNVTASLIKSNDGYIFQIQGNDTGAKNDLSISTSTTVPGLTPSSMRDKTSYTNGNSQSTEALTFTYRDSEGNLKAFTIPSAIDGAWQSTSSWSSTSSASGDVAFDYDGKNFSYSSAKENTFRSSEAAGKNDPLTQPIAFSYNGVDYSYDPAQWTGDMTLQQVHDAIKKDSNGDLDVALTKDDSGKFVLDVKPAAKRNASVPATGAAISGSFTSADDPAGHVTLTKADGTTHSYGSDADLTTSLDDMAALINADTKKTGLTAKVVENNGTFSLEVTEKLPADPTASLDIVSGGDRQQKSLAEMAATINADKANTGGVEAEVIANDDGTFALRLSGDPAKNLSNTTVNGVNVFGQAKASLKEQIAIINANADETGVTASLFKNANGEVQLELQSNNLDDVHVGKLLADGTFEVGDTFEAAGSTSSSWVKRNAQDAIFTLNDVPIEMTSASNELTDVIDGLTITLRDEGKANLTVTTDTGELRKNIETFVDGINTILKKFQDLTKYDEEKKTDDMVDEEGNFSKSLYSAQKGSVLTGNYGVTLLNSQIKSALSSRGKGFSGDDPFATLSAIGIVMDSDEGSPTFGQMVIKDSEDYTSTEVGTGLDKALEKDPLAVAELLAGMRGDSDTPGITYDSMLAGTTKPGNYKVDYAVDANGVVGNVTVGGYKAILADAKTNTYSLLEGPAKGLTFSINDLTAGSHSGVISVKQGKISELNEFLKEQSRNDPRELEGGKRGSLQVLKANYKDIMDGIDVKIEKEEKRLVMWETRQKMKFANLEALLGQYNGKQQTVSSQLGQLMQ